MQRRVSPEQESANRQEFKRLSDLYGLSISLYSPEQRHYDEISSSAYELEWLVSHSRDAKELRNWIETKAVHRSLPQDMRYEVVRRSLPAVKRELQKLIHSDDVLEAYRRTPSDLKQAMQAAGLIGRRSDRFRDPADRYFGESKARRKTMNVGEKAVRRIVREALDEHDTVATDVARLPPGELGSIDRSRLYDGLLEEFDEAYRILYHMMLHPMSHQEHAGLRDTFEDVKACIVEIESLRDQFVRGIK